MENSCSWRIVGQSLCQMTNNVKQKQGKRRRDGWWCNHWFDNKWNLSFLWKAEEDSGSLSAWGRAFQSLRAEFEKALEPNCFLVFSMIEEIVVVHSEESALEDIVELWHWSSCSSMKESVGQNSCSQEADEGILRQAWCVLSSFSVSQSSLLCSAQVKDSTIPDLAVPTNIYYSNSALTRPMQQRLKWLLS